MGPQASAADVRGEHGGQPVVRAAGGRRGADTRLLRGGPAGLRGRRAGLQLVDPGGLFPGLRADRGSAARALLPVQGRLRAGRRRGVAVVLVRGLAAAVLAGAGGGGGSGVDVPAAAGGATAAGGGVAGGGCAAAGGGGAELPE